MLSPGTGDRDLSAILAAAWPGTTAVLSVERDRGMAFMV
jgi:hypothetical protein